MSSSLLDQLVDAAKKHVFSTDESTRVDNIILGKSFYTMKGRDEVFADMNFCLVLLEAGYGFSYFQDEPDTSLSRFVNRDIVSTINEPMPVYMKIAMADALFSLINKDMFASGCTFTGTIREKAKARARILLEEVPMGARVLLLGAASEIIDELCTKRCEVQVLDLSEKKVGLRFVSTWVEDGREYELMDALDHCDYVIATGMVFLHPNVDELFHLAAIKKRQLFLYMETGSHFGPQLTSMGASMVLSECFPYYDFHGPTRFCVAKRSTNNAVADSLYV